MIAIDTNILVRFLVDEDPRQSALSRKFLEQELTAEHPGFVTTVTIVELAWVLRSQYRVSATAISDIISQLLDLEQLVVERADAVAVAISHAGQDIADALIHELGKLEGCDRTVTFDRRFARLDGVELLT